MRLIHCWKLGRRPRLNPELVSEQVLKKRYDYCTNRPRPEIRTSSYFRMETIRLRMKSGEWERKRLAGKRFRSMLSAWGIRAMPAPSLSPVRVICAITAARRRHACKKNHCKESPIGP